MIWEAALSKLWNRQHCIQQVTDTNEYDNTSNEKSDLCKMVG